MKEDQLITLCKNGDRKGFELLVHQYSPMLMAVCKRYMKEESSAKDALQECFISVFKHIKTFKDIGSFESWLRRIAVTSSLKELRKNRSKKNALTMVMENRENSIQEEPIAISSLQREDVLKRINSLSEDYRIAINMYVIEGYTYKEISTMLDISETTCRMRVSRARKKLHVLLNDQYNYGFESARKVD